jgi:hypothetical protein
LLHKRCPGTHIYRTLMTIKIVLFKLFPRLRGEFIQEILLRHLEANCLFMLHTRIPLHSA